MIDGTQLSDTEDNISSDLPQDDSGLDGNMVPTVAEPGIKSQAMKSMEVEFLILLEQIK